MGEQQKDMLALCVAEDAQSTGENVNWEDGNVSEEYAPMPHPIPQSNTTIFQCASWHAIYCTFRRKVFPTRSGRGGDIRIGLLANNVPDPLSWTCTLE